MFKSTNTTTNKPEVPISNYQDLLKFIAVIAMTCDHIGLYFFPDIHELRIIGRYAMPIFYFFAGYNFKGSVNLRVLFYGCLLYIISTVFIFNGHLLETNALIPIFLGWCCLYFIQKYCHDFLKGYLCFVALALLWPFTANILDYGTLGIALMVIGYMAKLQSINIKLAAFIFAFISMLHTVINFYNFDNFAFMSMLHITVINFYNFDNLDIFYVFIESFLLFVSISIGKFEQNICFNIRIISRHSMLIYFFQVLIMQIVLRYYIIS